MKTCNLQMNFYLYTALKDRYMYTDSNQYFMQIKFQTKLQFILVMYSVNSGARR